ncbi:bifunctional pyr operon transcriptional regulator/uracil phosphoribosyltransferase PyrR [Marinobacterium rhizophilum]|uniref:Bifunctional pyr operon transcriptional regulator/uracil phosphoribosyltransferase PyrR n=1 Tax=Marinobacterium rhizophilum TaxID=420402 RepID=A0ABY5HE51_9GAMM|nr:bifunctional pyr operon transcriptional regulator/uracil phosphoribosyltransferase PyrR [Marinobacterium rhizophilum]UTW10555.1 bifunctional pyr operon transcriptional regulator/uracil phosphoribosyltransferase PyrR [Marinobacterium rhizophilum]
MTSDNLSVDALLDSMGKQLKATLEQRQIENPLIVGIRTGGVWLAERLQQQLALQEPIGVLDISFYRDDFTQKGLNPSVQPSQLQSDTNGRHIILVDDVIMSGRTVRAALNELFDFGRPASVTLVTLLDLQRRELPVQADVVGATLVLGPNQVVKLSGPEPLELTIRQRT